MGNRVQVRWRMGVAGLVLMVAMGVWGGAAQGASVQERVAEAMEAADAEHGYLFLNDAEVERLRERVEEDALVGEVWSIVRENADAMLEMEPVEREQVGRRLLGVSRTVLKRVSYLGLAYRMSGDEAYLERAEREMLAAAGFSDWNPSHFLDVAEMTAALAIGYDWLGDDLSEQSRQVIRQAIVEKGLQTSIDEAGWWVTTTNNWSQVCHGGLTMGALAVMEHEPELAERIIVRALEHIDRPMDVYGPRGAYPEGPMYWAYGTTYNVLLIEALRTGLGDDFGLSDHERFMASAGYHLHMHGPTLQYFNYSDNREGARVEPAAFWFARQLEDPGLLWMERPKLEAFVQRTHSATGSGRRFLAFLPIWAGGLDERVEPGELHYVDEGQNPVATHRSGWADDATYITLKGGTPSENHGQMDTGSFVMDALGVRWAADLGMQGYNELEQAGIALWDRSQSSERWSVFRLNNHSKNTLVVDERLQRVEGFAPVVSHEAEGAMPHTVIDMSEVYEGQLGRAERGVALVGDDAALVQDELEAGDEPAQVRWAMLTRAEVEIVEPGAALLAQDGQSLGLRVLTPEGVELEIYESAEPPAEHDAANPGTQMIGFKVDLEAGEHRRLAVLLQPGGLEAAPVEVRALDQW